MNELKMFLAVGAGVAIGSFVGTFSGFLLMWIFTLAMR